MSVSFFVSFFSDAREPVSKLKSAGLEDFSYRVTFFTLPGATRADGLTDDFHGDSDGTSTSTFHRRAESFLISNVTNCSSPNSHFLPAPRTRVGCPDLVSVFLT